MATEFRKHNLNIKCTGCPPKKQGLMLFRAHFEGVKWPQIKKIVQNQILNRFLKCNGDLWSSTFYLRPFNLLK